LLRHSLTNTRLFNGATWSFFFLTLPFLNRFSGRGCVVDSLNMVAHEKYRSVSLLSSSCYYIRRRKWWVVNMVTLRGGSMLLDLCCKVGCWGVQVTDVEGIRWTQMDWIIEREWVFMVVLNRNDGWMEAVVGRRRPSNYNWVLIPKARRQDKKKVKK
jgi:hypothetical protein